MNPDVHDVHIGKHYATGAEVDASWARSSQKRQDQWTADPDQHIGKHYAAGAEVEADWSRGSQKRQDQWNAYYGARQPSHPQQQPQMYQPTPQQHPQMYQPTPQQQPQMYQPTPQQQPQMYQPTLQQQPQMYQPTPQQQPQMYQPSPQPYHTAVRPRSRSSEPPTWRAGRQPARQLYSTQSLGPQKEPWMKPFIAPNIENRPRTPGPILESWSESRNYSTAPLGPLQFGSYYGPETGGFYRGTRRGYGRSLSSSAYQPHSYAQQSAHQAQSGAIYRPQEFGGRDYYTLPARKKEITVASLVSGQAERPGPVDQVVPAWQQTADQKRSLYDAGAVAAVERPELIDAPPPWAQTAHQKRNLWEAHSTQIDPHVNRAPVGQDPLPNWARKADHTRALWGHEADALKQRSVMESELNRRSYHSQSQSTSQSYAPVQSWKGEEIRRL